MPIPEDAHQRLTNYLNTHTLTKGLGTKEAACTIAAINLALTGCLTDEIPACMSRVIGKWIIRVQDAMPTEVRNSRAWKSLLPDAAGTGRDREADRIRIILDWMWDDVLPQLSPLANEHGFGAVWATMLVERTTRAARSAAAAASLTSLTGSPFCTAADAAATAAAAAAAAAAADAAATAAANAAYAATVAADADADFWVRADPCQLLHKLITA